MGGTIVTWVMLLPQRYLVLGLILSWGYCMYRVLQVLPVFGFSGLLSL